MHAQQVRRAKRRADACAARSEDRARRVSEARGRRLDEARRGAQAAEVAAVADAAAARAEAAAAAQEEGEAPAPAPAGPSQLALLIKADVQARAGRAAQQRPTLRPALCSVGECSWLGARAALLSVKKAWRSECHGQARVAEALQRGGCACSCTAASGRMPASPRTSGLKSQAPDRRPASAQGSAEAVRDAALLLSSATVAVRVASLGVGAVTLADIGAAAIMGARVVAFNVECETQAVDTRARQAGVPVLCQPIIYRLIEARPADRSERQPRGVGSTCVAWCGRWPRAPQCQRVRAVCGSRRGAQPKPCAAARRRLRSG